MCTLYIAIYSQPKSEVYQNSHYFYIFIEIFKFICNSAKQRYGERQTAFEDKI